MISIYPISTYGLINIKTNLQPYNTIPIIIHDLNGNFIYKKELFGSIQEPIIQIDISDNPSGGYFIKVDNGSELCFENIKLIKQEKIGDRSKVKGYELVS